MVTDPVQKNQGVMLRASFYIWFAALIRLHLLQQVSNVFRQLRRDIPYNAVVLQRVLDYAVFNLLGYIAIYPGGVNKLEDQYGNVLPDCFLMPPGSTALDFAFKLHSDFGNNFVKAIDVKTKRTVGKDHMLKDGDIVEIVANR